MLIGKRLKKHLKRDCIKCKYCGVNRTCVNEDSVLFCSKLGAKQLCEKYEERN